MKKQDKIVNYISGTPTDSETLMMNFVNHGWTRHQVAGAVGSAIKVGRVSVCGQIWCARRKKIINVFS